MNWFAERTAGENAKIDLCILVVWLAEGFLWAFVLNFTNQEKHRKRNLMAAWMVCLLLFGCFTFVDISYLSSPDIWDSVRGNYWNQAFFLCSPIILLFVMELLDVHITKSKPYFIQKRSLLYFLVVLLLLYFITNKELNCAVGSMKYDIASGLYLLLLADIVLRRDVWETGAGRQPPKGGGIYDGYKCWSVSIFSGRE